MEPAWRSYEERIVPHLGAPFVPELRAAVPAGLVVDVATGTGALAAALAGPDRRVVGVDVEPGALAVARALRPWLPLLRGDAMALPLRYGRADAVTCQQGLQFLPDLDAALREAARVLVAGGALVALTWAEWGSVAVFSALAALAEAETGRTDVFRDPHALAPSRIAAGLRRAGFVDVTQRELIATMPQRDDADLLAHWTWHAPTVFTEPWHRAAAGARRDWVARFSTGLGDRRLRAVLSTARHPE